MNARSHQNDSPRTMRCFIALPAPAAVREACQTVMDALTSHAPPTRWVTLQNIHVTLKFLGDVARDRIAELEAALRAGVAAHAPFLLRTGGVGAFGSPRRPRVIWLGLHGDIAAVQALHAGIEETCAGLGFAPETRPYHPHFTLGRVKPGAGMAPEAWLTAVPAPETIEWVVQEVHLYESRLSASGAEYHTLAICSLSDAS